jgi:hypothetical protein
MHRGRICTFKIEVEYSHCTDILQIEIKFEETEAEDNERSKQESNGSN